MNTKRIDKVDYLEIINFIIEIDNEKVIDDLEVDS